MAVQYNSDKNSWGGFIVDIFKTKEAIVDVSSEANKFFLKYKNNGKDLSQIMRNVTSSNFTNNFIKQNKLADESLIAFLKDTKYRTKDLTSYQHYLKDTGQATSAFSSLTKSAGNVLKGFGAGLASMGVNMAIGMAINAAASAIGNWIHRVEKARERTAELYNEFDEMRNTLSSHKELAENSADRFDELSKGVDLTNNKNISLSSEEYKEFLDINKQLSDSFPGLIKGIDDSGNSILNLGTKGTTAKEQLQDLLDAEENLNNYKISQGLEEAFEGVYTYIEDADKAAEELTDIKNKTNEQMGVLSDYVENGVELNEGRNLLFKGDTGDKAKTDYAYKVQSTALEFFDGLDNNRREDLQKAGVDPSSLFTIENNNFTGSYDFYSNLYSLTPDEISDLEAMISDNVKQLNGALMDQFNDKKTELEEQVQTGKYAWADFLPNLVAGMKSKQTFQNLDPELQDNIVQIVGNMDYNSANEMMKYNSDPYVYIRDNIIGPISELTDNDEILKAKSTLNSLLKLDKDDLSDNNQAAITKMLEDLSTILDKDPVEIRAILGYDITDEQASYKQALVETKKKLNGFDYSGKFPTLNDDGQLLDVFWNKNVKTSDDVALWNKVTEGITNATDAINAYKNAKEPPETDAVQKQTFSEAWASIGTSDDEQANNTALEAKQKLLELAEAGKLTKKELAKSPLADYFKETGVSIDEAVEKINQMKSCASQLASMETGISSITSILDEKEQNLSAKETKKTGIGAAALNAMPDDIKAQTKEYDNFVKVLGDGSSSMDDCRAAANDLATAYVNSNNFLANLTKGEEDHYISLLKKMGVENAAAVVTNALNRQKLVAKMKSFDLKTATEGEITELGQYITSLDESGKSLAYFMIQQQIANNNALDTSDSIQNLKLLANIPIEERDKALEKPKNKFYTDKDALQIK